MRNARQEGFATVFVLMLASVLLVLLGLAMHFMYLAHEHNRQERQAILKRVEVLNHAAAVTEAPKKTPAQR